MLKAKYILLAVILVIASGFMTEFLHVEYLRFWVGFVIGYVCMSNYSAERDNL